MIIDGFKRTVIVFCSVLIVFISFFATGIGSINVFAVDSGDLVSDAVPDAASSSGGSSSGGGAQGSSGSLENGEEFDIYSLDSITADNLEVTADAVILATEQQLEDFPSGAGMQSGVYMTVDTSAFGQITIWIPSGNQYRSFALNDNGVPVNITSGTITGYYYGGADYAIRWSSFGQAAYRETGSNYYDWADLNISEVVNTNVAMGQQQYIMLPSAEILLYLLIFVLGAAVIWICTR